MISMNDTTMLDLIVINVIYKLKSNQHLQALICVSSNSLLKYLTASSALICKIETYLL